MENRGTEKIRSADRVECAADERIRSENRDFSGTGARRHVFKLSRVKADRSAEC